LKQIIEEAVENKLSEVLGDPDEGLELREEIKARLERSLEAHGEEVRGIPGQQVAAGLGLEWRSS
jgi:hypothetical protein